MTNREPGDKNQRPPSRERIVRLPDNADVAPARRIHRVDGGAGEKTKDRQPLSSWEDVRRFLEMNSNGMVVLSTAGRYVCLKKHQREAEDATDYIKSLINQRALENFRHFSTVELGILRELMRANKVTSLDLVAAFTGRTPWQVLLARKS